VTVMAQAGKCRELQDRLRNLGIRQQFRHSGDQTSAPSSSEIPDQILKLASLRDQGILSEDEFQTKKAELLGRM
jgi:hypothetical protein